jgi:enoyl-CoA hydratase
MLVAEHQPDFQAVLPQDLQGPLLPADKLLAEAIAVATKISELSQPIAMMVKESVNRAFETTLAEGVRFERRLFHSTFATEDQKEGMAAFVEKRKPAFRNR